MAQDETGSFERLSLAHRLLRIIHSSWMTQAAYVAAKLGIADLLADGPKTSDELAAATGTHPRSLHRLLRALTTIGICRQRDDGAFEITPMGSLLASQAPESLRAWTIWWGEHLWPVWGHLLHSVKTGESARRLLLGTDGFQHLQHNQQTAAVFNEALAELSRLTRQGVVRAYDFSGLKQIVDVGGGYGDLLAAILTAHPGASGVLFDLPHATEGGRRRIEQAGLAGRCEFVAGDFFESVPSGGDAYVLQSVIHDWDDERSRVILENCRRTMAAGARLLLVEHVLPDRLETSAAHQSVVRSDLNMLVAQGAKERTEGEFHSLMKSSSFGVTRIVPVWATFSVIEAFPLR